MDGATKMVDQNDCALDQNNENSIRSSVMRTKACFRLGPGEVHPDEITRALRIQPSHAHCAGEPRPGPRMRKPWGENMWLLESPLPDSADASAHIRGLLDRLEPRIRAIRRLQQRGVQASFFIGCFPETDQCMMQFDSDTLSRIARFRADLILDIYPVQD